MAPGFNPRQEDPPLPLCKCSDSFGGGLECVCAGSEGGGLECAGSEGGGLDCAGSDDGELECVCADSDAADVAEVELEAARAPRAGPLRAFAAGEFRNGGSSAIA